MFVSTILCLLLIQLQRNLQHRFARSSECQTGPGSAVGIGIDVEFVHIGLRDSLLMDQLAINQRA